MITSSDHFSCQNKCLCRTKIIAESFSPCNGSRQSAADVHARRTLFTGGHSRQADTVHWRAFTPGGYCSLAGIHARRVLLTGGLSRPADIVHWWAFTPGSRSMASHGAESPGNFCQHLNCSVDFFARVLSPDRESQRAARSLPVRTDRGQNM